MLDGKLITLCTLQFVILVICSKIHSDNYQIEYINGCQKLLQLQFNACYIILLYLNKNVKAKQYTESECDLQQLLIFLHQFIITDNKFTHCFPSRICPHVITYQSITRYVARDVMIIFSFSRLQNYSYFSDKCWRTCNGYRICRLYQICDSQCGKHLRS